MEVRESLPRGVAWEEYRESVKRGGRRACGRGEEEEGGRKGRRRRREEDRGGQSSDLSRTNVDVELPTTERLSSELERYRIRACY